MADNFISRGDLLTLTADSPRETGEPIREHGFNGVALIDVEAGESYTFQIQGVFEFPLSMVEVGDLICIDRDGKLNAVKDSTLRDHHRIFGALYGHAVTDTDSDGNFRCLILQSE